MKFCLLRKPLAVYFTYWISALMDSLAALENLHAERHRKMLCNAQLVNAREIRGRLQGLFLTAIVVALVRDDYG